MKLYADISKTEEQSDGTIKVWGYASSAAVDSDGETITPAAMKAALPDYMKFGAVREMHQASAAGTAIEAEVQDDGRTFFGAHVVDPVAVKKVQAKVYKGFSIGGKVTARDTLDKSIISGIKLVEISLVDRPANPEAMFTMFKVEENGSDESAVDALAKLLDAGEISAERLVELAKAEITPAEQPIEQPKPATVEKGMYSVAQLAQLLADLNNVQQSCEAEAGYEGDGSPIPADLKDAVKNLSDILVRMTVEETSELTADPDAMPEVTQMAEPTGDLDKAGARNSKGDQKKIQDVHDHSVALGADCPMAGKGAHADDLTKLAQQAEQLEKLEQEKDVLTKRVAELEAMPVAPKGSLKAVEKGQDIGQTETAKADADESQLTKGMSPEKLAEHQIKKIFMTGGRPLSQR